MSKLDPRQTLISLPNEIPWQVPDVAPPDSVAEDGPAPPAVTAKIGPYHGL